MGLFTKILIVVLGAALLFIPLLAARSGWGLGTEKDSTVIQSVDRNSCPDFQRDAFGKCRRSHRSYFGGRSYVGGGPGFGK